MDKIELKKEELIKALIRNLGNVTQSCQDVGMSRDRYYVYLRTDKEFKRKVDDIDNIQLDFVESKLIENIKAGDKGSIMFYMRYKGRKRGYTDSIDLNVSGNINITTKWGDEKPENDDENIDETED